jgi:diguanylate cyclase (GGDEF)-like protein/PAS domain S-box-containing protein
MQGSLHLTPKELATLGYKELSLISETESHCIYRAVTHDDRALFVKEIASTRPYGIANHSLEHELEVAADLNPQFVVKPIEIERFGDHRVLILEACDYPPLTRLMQRPLDVETFLPIASGIAAALSHVHGKGLVHKEIRPANIFARTDGQVKLTGFGISTMSKREPPSTNPEAMDNDALAYMAPEQTGRMNRSVDSRSDLYALGVTFYQMLTGVLPFTASDPMDWVHCHIARQPAPPRALLPSVPGTISDIVMKLMAKTAEERYQTAEGLKHDLDRCLEEWLANGRIAPFPPGEHDIPDRLMTPEKLYGREQDVATLLAAFDRVVAGGKPELVLVSGYSGIGKSMVVNELHKALVPSRGRFASGKFDQSKRGIPYSAFTQVLRMLIRPLLGKSESELAQWRRDLQEALDPNGQLILELVPELKFIIGEQPPLPELDPQQVKLRFQLVFRRFIGVFARAGHPLALFIDDLQWLDAATLDLLEDLATQDEVQQLLLIGAYRDNEVGQDHPLRRRLEAIRDAGVGIREIRLSPLTLADLTKMIMDTLHCEPERASQLAELVHAKTAGNPFFALQFLTTLTQEGLFSYGQGCWTWDLNQIQAKGYTDNVADLMATKLTRLPSCAQRAMQMLTCLGTSSPTHMLSQVLETPEEEVDVALREAVRHEFVQKTGSAYHFVHDRVQEAAYALIPETSRAETHLRIGKALLAHSSEKERMENVFEIVNQLNRGAALLEKQVEREELARLNLLAGRRAKGSTAYTEALAYLTTGASLLSGECWQNQHQLAFDLETDRAECEYLTGELEAAENRLTTLFNHATGSVERARIASLSIDLYMTLGNISGAVAVGLDYLRHLGIEWTSHPTEAQARDEYDLIWSTLDGHAIEDLIDLPLMRDPALIATMEVLIKLRPPALFTDVNLVSMVICKAVNLSLAHGNTDASCFAYASLGIVAASRYGNYLEAYRFGKLGYDLVEQRGLRRFQARTYTNFGIFDLPWVKHVRAGRDLLRRAFNDTKRSGDIVYGAYACNNLISNLLMTGDPLVEVEYEALKGLDYVNKARFRLVADIITSQLGLIRSLRGETRKLGSFEDKQFDEQQFETHFSDQPQLAVAECFHWIRKLQALLFAGDYAAAIEASDRARDLLWTARPFIEMAEYSFYAALCRTLSCDSSDDDKYQQHGETIAAQHRQLEIWARICPQNFHDRASLVGAEIARIEDRPFDAMQLYEKAIHSAHSNGFLHNEALANELAGRFYLGRGLESTGLAHLRQARASYSDWGADAKKRQLDMRYPQLVLARTAIAASNGDSLSPQLDLATVIMASHAVSGEIELPKLIETLIKRAIKYAGANRGVLILPRDNGFEVEVEAKTSGMGIDVRLVRSAVAETGCPQTIVNYVIHTEQSVIIDDAHRPGKFIEDPYLRRGAARSILCLPLIRQGKLSGVLYLENTLAVGAFTSNRVAVLEVLAAQAAISLENAHLYEELRESESKYQRMFETANEGIWVQDENFRTTFANEHMAQMLGYTAAELINHKVTDFMFDDDACDHAHKMEERSRDVSDVYERRLRHKDGSTIWMLISATPIFENGRFRGSFAMLTDITERKKAEQQLAASEQLFRTMVENSPDHIARYDRKLRRLYVNPKLRREFTIPIEKAMGKTAKTDSPLLDPEGYMKNLRRVIDTGQEYSGEIAYRKPTGETRWASTRFAPEMGPDGKVESVLVISSDITERRHAELERQAHVHFLQSLDRINRILQSEGDIEQIMNRTLTEVLDIFDCDRAFLLYPCDPDATTWSVPIESTKAEYPGASKLGPQPMNEGIAWVLRTLLESEHTVCMGPDTQYPVPQVLHEQFGIRALMSTLLRPRVDTPWQFGVQQCSRDRTWSDQEVRLFEEISNRLTDSLNNLLITRNLHESEERFRLVFESSPVPIQEEDYSAVKAYLESLRPQYNDDLEGFLDSHPEVMNECAALVEMINVNQAALTLHEADGKAALLQGLAQIFTSETLAGYKDVLIFLMQGRTNFRLESVIQTLGGHRHEIDVFVSVCPGYEQSLGRVLVSLIDITELKNAEQEHQAHLRFLESLDRVNRVLQAEGDIEQIMNKALDEVLDIFDCDRAYLVYPNDPNASTWSVPIESNKPEYPGASKLGPQPVDDKVAWVMNAVLETDGPVRMGQEDQIPVPFSFKDLFGIQANMAMALYPRVDKPWQFGIHQCSEERIWTEQEMRLFEEIGHRLSDALNNLLVSRDLHESEERFRLVYENSPVPTWEEDFSAVKARLDELCEEHGSNFETYLIEHPEIVTECASMVRIINVNDATLELHGAASKDALYEGLLKTFTPDSFTAFRNELIALSRGETELNFDAVVQTLGGQPREVNVSFVVCPGYEQSLSKVFVSLFDITQRKQDEEGLRLAASVFSTSQEGILISDADNLIIDVNPAFTHLTGYSREEALGRNPGFLSAGRQEPGFYAGMWQSINTTGEWQGELWNRRKTGEVFPELLSIVAVRDEQGVLQHYVGAFSDISMIKQHEEDLDRIAHYDMLTSVPNRRLLSDRLEQAIAHTRRHGKNLAVCYLDLDGFKPINDQFGHEGGDHMLVEIAKRLESVSRGEDTVARLGGDEFVLLWNDIASEADCIHGLERILDKVAEPMLIDGEPVSVSASVGVTLFPDDDVDADSLLRHADHAMYTAKQLGKNRYQIFDARLERQISAQAELLTLIAQGLDRKQFELYYQPKIDYVTGNVVGAEALLRWNDPVLGLIGPKEFLSLIENDSLAFRMGRWVMEEAVRQAKRWHEQGITLPISINVFPRHLKYRTFIDDLRNVIALHWPQLPKNRLLMEIVETADLEDLEPIEEVIKECVELGIGFSLDDFGTGYSSLVYLRRLSIEEIKIDQSFVRDMLEDPDDEAIVIGVISLGQAFGLRVVAEGVETIQQADHLVELGCTIVQGYGLGRPMPPRVLQKWYADFNVNELKQWLS